MFRQFRENISAAQETYKAARQGCRSVRDAYRKADWLTRVGWLAVPATILSDLVGRYLSLAWYIRFPLELVLVAVATRPAPSSSHASEIKKP